MQDSGSYVVWGPCRLETESRSGIPSQLYPTHSQIRLTWFNCLIGVHDKKDSGRKESSRGSVEIMACASV
jgi:hypothetical protein